MLTILELQQADIGGNGRVWQGVQGVVVILYYLLMAFSMEFKGGGHIPDPVMLLQTSLSVSKTSLTSLRKVLFSNNSLGGTVGHLRRDQSYIEGARKLATFLKTAMGNGFSHALDLPLSPLPLRVVRGPPTATSRRETSVHQTAEPQFRWGSFWFWGRFEKSKLMASCPHLDVLIGEVNVPCLLDTRAMVLTVIKSLFCQF